MGIGKLIYYLFLWMIKLGTSPLRHYAYSHIGCPAILKGSKKLLQYNLTLTATISINGAEFLGFTY